MVTKEGRRLLAGLPPNEFSFVCSRHRIGIRRARSDSPPYLSLLPLSLSLRHRHPDGIFLPHLSLYLYPSLVCIPFFLIYSLFRRVPFLPFVSLRLIHSQLTTNLPLLPYSSRFQ